MITELTGAMGVVLNGIRTAIGLSEIWQTWTGSADATEAAARVVMLMGVRPAYPFIAIAMDDGAGKIMDSNTDGSASFGPRTEGAVILQFWYQPESGFDESDEAIYTRFFNQVELVVAEILAQNGNSAGTVPVIRSAIFPDGVPTEYPVETGQPLELSFAVLLAV